MSYLRQTGFAPVAAYAHRPRGAGPFHTAITRQLEDAPARYAVRFLCRPGRFLSDDRLTTLVAELRRVATACFDELPSYQCLTGSREELSQSVLTCAYRPDGSMAGFCAALLLPVPGIGNVLHLGLPCVHPGERGSGLTHRLTAALALRYLLTRAPFSRQWVTNLACVLSSLGNVAMHFEQIYPSPDWQAAPTDKHRHIAAEIDRHHRARMFVNADAVFDPEKFIFRGSVRDTVFQKSPDDARYHHRDGRLNEFYRRYMDIAAGDEVLQVGSVSLLAYPAYLLRRWWAGAHEPALARAITGEGARDRPPTAGARG